MYLILQSFFFDQTGASVPPTVLLKLTPALKLLVTIHIRIVPETYLYKAPITTNRYLVTSGFRKQTSKIWGSFVLNLDYGHCQQS